ncbi:MAG: hypothetical protein P9L99_10365 [Candidatus Lernaella stagnicola]|nr:hypothetical protein [Candidatus Lernaella stagnicola]
MTRAFRPVGALLTLAALAVWVLYLAVDTDYDEHTLLAQLVLLALCIWIFAWRREIGPPKILTITGIIITMLMLGHLAQLRAVWVSQVKRTVARNVLLTVADDLQKMETTGLPLPESIAWEELRGVFATAGVWQPLSMPNEAGKRVVHYPRVPRHDEWGCKYEYAKIGVHEFRLRSSGQDRRWNTADDIVVATGPATRLVAHALPGDLSFVARQ